jgi:hypothetical protein
MGDDERERLEQQQQVKRMMIAEGVLNPDGSPRHTCPWCCQSFDYVLGGAAYHFENLRDLLAAKPWWWRWRHPLLAQYMAGQRDTFADVLDDAGK